MSAINLQTSEFVTTTLSGAMAAAAATATIGAGLGIPATNGVLQIDYDSSTAVGLDNGPETIKYASYTTATGALAGITRGQSGTTDVAHASGASVHAGTTVLRSVGELGFTTKAANFSTASATAVQVTGLSVTVTIPAGGRSIRITVGADSVYAGASALVVASIWDGTVATGTQVGQASASITGAAVQVPLCMTTVVSAPTAGSKTYNVGLKTSADTATMVGHASYPSFILVELI